MQVVGPTDAMRHGGDWQMVSQRRWKKSVPVSSLSLVGGGVGESLWDLVELTDRRSCSVRGAAGPWKSF